MRKSTQKKLQLHRETLKSLTTHDLRDAVAGVPTGFGGSGLIQCISDCRGCVTGGYDAREPIETNRGMLA